MNEHLPQRRVHTTCCVSGAQVRYENALPGIRLSVTKPQLCARYPCHVDLERIVRPSNATQNLVLKYEMSTAIICNNYWTSETIHAIDDTFF